MSLPPPRPAPPDSSPLSADGEEYVDPGARAIDLSRRPVADSLREIMASSPRLPKPPPPLPPRPNDFTNRHWTLALFGLLELAFAFLLAGFGVWEAVAGGLEELAADPPERARLLVATPFWTVWSLALGLGLILARRWARALTVAACVQTVMWAGISAIAVVTSTAPDLRVPLSPLDQTPVWFYGASLLVIMVIFGLAALVLHSPNVRLTCERAQPRSDWTDRRSLAELILVMVLTDLALTWAGHATHHPWPCWGSWRSDHIGAVWGFDAALAATAAILVAVGRRTGSWLALILVLAAASSVVMTALHEPVEDFATLWGQWDFNLRGGVTYTVLEAVAVASLAVAALRACARRNAPTPEPGT